MSKDALGVGNGDRRTGVVVDSLTFSTVILVVPFQLKALGYTHVASLTGWLVFAGGVGEVIGSLPIAMWSEAHDTRKSPSVAGILMVIISQVMFMEAPSYWVMCLARCLHGIGSAARMVIGPAVVCDQSPSSVVGRQLGIALSGVTVGLLLGSPIGGPLYSHFGFRGPFVFNVIAVLPVLTLWLLIVQVRYVPGSPSSANRSDEIPLESERRGSNDMETTVTSDRVQNKTSFVKVLRLMLQSPRAVTAFCIVFVHGMLDVLLQPVIPSHLNSIWGLNVSQVGLVFLASTIPAVLAVLLSGWLADRRGVSVVVVITSTVAMVWFVILSMAEHLSLFVIAYFFASFFGNGVLAPLLAEFASISRSIDGVGHPHVYGALYLAFGIGTTIRPALSGQMYDNISKGWIAVCLMAVRLHALCAVVTFFYIGEKPIARGFFQRIRHLVS
ncbi:major facilitator superfamily domain-containing protein [Armillaria nabsnona]|nr:major facilitator superfamily domain-containing protein [Armillaria nabsnona]